MDYSLKKIAEILEAPGSFSEEIRVSHLLIDSRKIHFPTFSLFFALRGTSGDGHHYIPALYAEGVRAFVVSKNIDESRYPDASFLHVTDTLNALRNIAKFHRHEFTFPVIAITGSNGKTIIKELLYQLLHQDYNIVRSPKSFNSQIGVPLSIWQMNEYNDLGIFEAGISKPGEMEKLRDIIDPSIGVFSSIGDAHAQGFLSVGQKISEKLKLFENAQVLIYPANDLLLDESIRNFSTLHPTLSLFSWGNNEGCDLIVSDIKKDASGSNITCRFKDEDFILVIPFTDEASINNCLSCCAVLLYMKIPIFIISQRMKSLTQVEMRLELKQGNANCSIINDSYSSDINSLAIALEFLQQQQQHERRTVILSDVLQSGLSPERLYKFIADIVDKKKLYRFIGIGESIARHAGFFGMENKIFFNTTDQFLEALPALDFRDETILLKGARIFEFEKINNALEQKNHQTLLEIDLSAIRHNLEAYRSTLAPAVKLMAMVKAFSYGSGTFEIANLLQFSSVDYLAVAYADEGVSLRQAGIRLPLMVMNADISAFESILKFQLQPELYSFKIFDDFRQFLQQKNIQAFPVHIKLDTGMHRLGFQENDMELLCEKIKGQSEFRIESVFSHLVASDESIHDHFTEGQRQSFLDMAAQLEAANGQPFLRHIANTSAITRLPELQLDMVRLGIGLYGVDANVAMQAKLNNVATLKTTVAQIKDVKAGESVGYSRKGIMLRDSTIATVRIGYADGYRRNLGNGKGKMLVNGQLANIVGNVCMDMTMIDITGMEVREGDEVIVFGPGLPVYILAGWADSIPYEILTNISQRVKRVYFDT